MLNELEDVCMTELLMLHFRLCAKVPHQGNKYKKHYAMNVPERDFKTEDQTTIFVL